MKKYNYSYITMIIFSKRFMLKVYKKAIKMHKEIDTRLINEGMINENLWEETSEEEKKNHSIISEKIDTKLGNIDFNNKEEEKDHEILTEKISERIEKSQEYFLESMQYNGSKELFEENRDDMKELLKYEEKERTIEHENKAIEIMEKISPDTSPGKGQINVTTSLIKAIEIDKKEAINEDNKELQDFFIDTSKEITHNGISSGTDMKYNDGLSDFLK